MRQNAGFQIIVAVPIGKDAPQSNMEIVIGGRETTLGGQFVCWFCQSGCDYYWGRYTATYEEALTVLIDRLSAYHPKSLKGERL